MDFSEFTEAIKNLFIERNDRLDVSIRTVRKNNSVRYTGLTVKGVSDTAAPIIYLEPFYRQFMETADIDGVVDDIIRVYEQNEFSFDPDSIMDFDSIKYRIIYQVINKHLNQEMLKEVPHRYLVDDIVIIYKIWLGQRDKDVSANIRVTNTLMELWSANEDLLWTCAEENTSRLLKSKYLRMEDLITEMLSKEQLLLSNTTNSMFTDTDIGLYVATNEEKLNGASVIADKEFMKEFHKDIGDFYILPSSIHEVIAIPAVDMVDVQMLKNMVRDVNSTSVSAEDYLSDNVYYYDGNRIVAV